MIALRIGAWLVLGVLLLVFQYVVAQAEHAGALRRAAMLAESDARGQCEALQQASARGACRARLKPMPRENAQLSSR